MQMMLKTWTMPLHEISTKVHLWNTYPSCKMSSWTQKHPKHSLRRATACSFRRCLDGIHTTDIRTEENTYNVRDILHSFPLSLSWLLCTLWWSTCTEVKKGDFFGTPSDFGGVNWHNQKQKPWCTRPEVDPKSTAKLAKLANLTNPLGFMIIWNCCCGAQVWSEKTGWTFSSYWLHPETQDNSVQTL